MGNASASKGAVRVSVSSAEWFQQGLDERLLLLMLRGVRASHGSALGFLGESSLHLSVAYFIYVSGRCHPGAVNSHPLGRRSTVSLRSLSCQCRALAVDEVGSGKRLISTGLCSVWARIGPGPYEIHGKEFKSIV